ncbi:Aste57867_18127 [Aphanomyces stellatus]|uniref:Aste57867_18127 protein n=1 Tax=Aphanomyces stellatus TaxID=120398 RepID=A0A485L9X5_9STRA|nr:hypothetical protein As57867_018065 [Aphanomyces stellatus]VFT94865.1 Aste57867_18127 [Aphanomyces stellatus]
MSASTELTTKSMMPEERTNLLSPSSTTESSPNMAVGDDWLDLLEMQAMLSPSIHVRRTQSLSIVLEGDPAYDAIVMHRLSSTQRACGRLPALLATFAIELVVAFVVSRFTATLQTFPLLIAFMPVISAVSGNVGLQSSSIVTRALALGLISPDDAVAAIRRELSAAVVLGALLGLVTGVIAAVWQNWLVFGVVVGVAQFLSIWTAALTGSAAPLVAKWFSMDPASAAGPMETAIQDVVGNSLFLVFASSLLNYFA